MQFAIIFKNISPPLNRPGKKVGLATKIIPQLDIIIIMAKKTAKTKYKAEINDPNKIRIIKVSPTIE